MKNFYKLISVLFQPLLMPTFAIALLMNIDLFTMIPAVWRWIAIIGTFVFTALLPAVPIYMMMRRGEVNDLFISKREERTMPYLFTFMAYVFWALFLWRTMQMPLFIVAMGMSSALSILAILFINLRWKISAHMTGIGGFVGSVFAVCYRLAINPLWFLAAILAVSGLVALSRIELKAHTPLQTLAGFIVGFVMVFGASFVF